VQARLITLDQSLEGVLVAAPRQVDQGGVVLKLEEGRTPGEQPASLSVCEC
jgi:hypothetical protein